MKIEITDEERKKQPYPDWITDQQWAAVPSVYHWLNQKNGKEYQEQLPPLTLEETQAQFERLRNEKSWKEGK